MDFSKINELKPYDLNCNIFDVYSYNGLSMQELLCQFFTKINECVKTSNEIIDLADWLVNEGLKQEIALKLTTWLNDGTLENLINVTLFENLNKKIDNFSSQLEDIAINIKNLCNDDSNITDVFKTVLTECDNYQKILIPNGEYVIKDTLVLKNKTGVIIECYGTLIFENNNDCFVVEGGSRNRINNLRIKRKYKTGVPASDVLIHDGFVLRNTKYNTINSLYVEGCKRGVYLNATESSTAYNHFYDSSIFNCLISYENDFINGFSNEVKTFGGRFSINESLFTDYTGSCYVKIAKGSDMHIFNGVCMEGEVTDRKVLCNGNHCVFESCRFEQTNRSNTDIEVNGSFNYFIANRMSQDTGGTKIVEGENAKYNVYMNDRELSLGSAIKQKTTILKADTTETFRHTLNSTDSILLIDSSNANECIITMNVRNMGLDKGREVTIIKTDSSNTPVRLAGMNVGLTKQYETFVLVNDGEKWIIKHKPIIKSNNSNDSSFIKYDNGVMIQNIKKSTNVEISTPENGVYRSGFIILTLQENYSTSNYSVTSSVLCNNRNVWCGSVEIIDTKSFKIQLLSSSNLSNVDVTINAICFGF